MTNRQMTEPSGWVTYAATMILLVATLNAFFGLVLLIKDDWVVLTPESFLFFDSNAWGVTLLIIAVLQFIVAGGVIGGQTWARITGIFFAFINLVALFPIFGVYPLWNLLVATLLVLVIYGLAAHGDEVGA